MQPSFDRIRTNGCGRDARAPRGAPTKPVSGYGTCLGQVPESGRVFRLLAWWEGIGINHPRPPPGQALTPTLSLRERGIWLPLSLLRERGLAVWLMSLVLR